jgi:acid stress-induced BolA-like protein IbaG/YrbA
VTNKEKLALFERLERMETILEALSEQMGEYYFHDLQIKLRQVDEEYQRKREQPYDFKD